jgi:hypothetical protein
VIEKFAEWRENGHNRIAGGIAGLSMRLLLSY